MKDTHDRRRIHYQTKKSFDKILANIGVALEQGVSIAIRVNTDANNFDELPQLEQIFKEFGYIEHPKFSMNSSPVVNYNQLGGQSINFLNQMEFEQRHKDINYKYQCNGVTILAKTLYSAIKGQKRLYFSSTFCAAQVGMYILDPLGKIYTCWDDVGKQNVSVGNYLNDPIEWNDNLDSWHNQNISNSDKCTNCKYAFFCKGGCIARETIQNGKFGSGFCNSFPVTFEHAVNLVHHQMSNKN